MTTLVHHGCRQVSWSRSAERERERAIIMRVGENRNWIVHLATAEKSNDCEMQKSKGALIWDNERFPDNQKGTIVGDSFSF